MAVSFAMGRPRFRARPVHPPAEVVFDADEHLWVTDACNHRIQVFDTLGKLLKCGGRKAAGRASLYYPYDIALAPDDTLYLCEYGNHRIQKFTRDGRSLGCFGRQGRGNRASCSIPGAWPWTSRGSCRVG